MRAFTSAGKSSIDGLARKDWLCASSHHVQDHFPTQPEGYGVILSVAAGPVIAALVGRLLTHLNERFHSFEGSDVQSDARGNQVP